MFYLYFLDCEWIFATAVELHAKLFRRPNWSGYFWLDRNQFGVFWFRCCRYCWMLHNLFPRLGSLLRFSKVVRRNFKRSNNSVKRCLWSHGTKDWRSPFFENPSFCIQRSSQVGYKSFNFPFIFWNLDRVKLLTRILNEFRKETRMITNLVGAPDARTPIIRFSYTHAVHSKFIFLANSSNFHF
jgi:hypothetical protein